MLFEKLTVALATALLGLGCAEPIPLRRRADLDEFIAKQRNISIAGVLANIGADGSEASGVPAGVVIASPSKSDPDCKLPSFVTYLFFTNVMGLPRLLHLDP